MDKWPLPERWGWKAIGDPNVAQVIMGQSPPGNTYNDDRNGLPFFQGKADFGELYPTARKWCSQPTKIAEPDDVLISVRAPVGPTNLCKERCCIGRGLAALRASSTTETKYLLYALRAFEPEIAQMGQGSTFAAISKTDLVRVEIPCPPLETQHRIVARLDALFAELAEARTLYADICRGSDSLVNACIRDIFDPPNEEWTTIQLGNAAFIQTGTAKGRRFGNRKTIELPYLRVANVQAGYLKLDEIKTIQIAEDEIDRYRLQPGDLLLTEGGDFDKLGRGAVWHGEVELCVHQNHIFAVRFDPTVVMPEFVEYELQSAYAKSYFLGVAKKTTNLATINKTQLGVFPLRYPLLREQRAIVKRLDEAKAQVAEVQHVQDSTGAMLDELGQAILSQAFRGELV